MSADPLTGAAFVDALLGRAPAGDGAIELHRVMTYGELRDRIGGWSAKLESHGVRAGTTVALQVPPSITGIEILLALWRMDAQVLLFDYRLKPAETAEYAKLARPEMFVRAREGAELLAPFKEERDVVVEPAPDGGPARTAHALVQFTSGSTGRPKIIGRTRESLLAEVERWSALDGAIRSGDRVLVLSSPTHALGLVGGILQTLHAGARLVFSPGYQASDTLGALARSEATAIVGPPFHYKLLATVKGGERLPHLRFAISGGERLDADVHRRFEDKYGVPIGEAYGMTEVGIVAVDLGGRAFPSSGRPAPGIRVEARDGEIYVHLGRTPYLYSEDPAAFVDGWLRSYDRGEIDRERGTITITGRSDSLVIIGGLKVNLLEVEAALSLHERVGEVVVLHGEGIEAYVGARGEIAPGELVQWCKERLANYKVPKRFFVCPALPRTTTGKLIRHLDTLRRAAGAPS